MKIHAQRTVLSRKYIVCFILGIGLSIVPTNFKLTNDLLDKSSIGLIEGLPSNGVIDIGISSDSLLFYGTGGGLGKSVTLDEQINFYTINSFNLPRGGNPALYVKDSIVVVSGVVDTLAQDEYFSKGTGISISTDYGLTWQYFNQPIDPIPDDGLYLYSDWYSNSVKYLAVTVAINNVSYDVTVNGDYIYSASWAGGIRRIQFRNIPPVIDGVIKEWEVVPLPMDDSFQLFCDYPLSDYYILNPNDPSNGGNHNHKGFAVESQNDSIIWVGTANGVNKGIIDDNNCISWTHYTSVTHNISGNWVIGFNIQKIQSANLPRIWAITWSTNSAENNGLSYTDNLGSSWKTSNMIEDLGLKVFNISSKNEKVYIATDKGLYFSLDGDYWEKLSRPIEFDNDGNIVEEILSEAVYSVAETSEFLWVGTGDGIGKTNNLGIDWSAYRFFEPPTNFYAYPNPFFVDINNRVNGDGHVRFICNANVKPNKILVYDYSMNLVVELNDFRTIDNENELIWNGRNSINMVVSNGVYFCNLIYNEGSFWTKLLVIN